jgi:hypothetical protein
MRAHTIKIVLFTVVALVGRVAVARTVTPHHKAVRVSEEKAVPSHRRSALSARELRAAHTLDAASRARVPEGSHSHAFEAERVHPVEPSRIRTPEVKVAERLSTIPAERASELKPDPEPALPPIHIVHNRKIHYSESYATGISTPPDDPILTTDADDSQPAPAPLAASVKVSAASAPTHPGPILRALPVAEASAKTRPTVTPSTENKPVPRNAVPPTFEAASAPPPIAPLYTKTGHLIVPPPLKGSHEILVHQNVMADREGLDRIQDDAELEQLRRERQLVPLPEAHGLEVDERLPLNRRYCRPWTAQFLTDLAKAHEQHFHTALQVNSAVRTVEFQERLRTTNGNAAPADGESASPHLTGQAVDLAKHGLSTAEIAWLRDYLLPLVQTGKVDVEEEFQQACFHISVYKKYAPEPLPRSRHTASALAAALR